MNNRKRVGQTSVGPNRDIRIDARGDYYEIIEVVYPQTDIHMQPVYKLRVQCKLEGLRRLTNLLDAILDSIEGVAPENSLPINDSDHFANHFQEGA